MTTKQNKLTDYLSSIIEKNEDAVKGYKKAAEHADQLRLQNYFNNKSSERQGFLNDLQANISKHGMNDFDDSGSTKGAMHRSWMDVKALFSANDDEAMLEEAQRGDEAAVEEYESILNDNILPESTSMIIREQVVQIRKDLNKIKSLEDLH